MNEINDPITKAESIVSNYLARYPSLHVFEGPTPSTVAALYRRDEDKIIIRPEWDPEFGGSLESWYRALFHEITHSTGHATRNNRKMGWRTDDYLYGIEELTAELGSSFLTEECGMISVTGRLHAQYLQHYIHELNAGPGTLERAIEQATDAVRLILGPDGNTLEMAA